MMINKGLTVLGLVFLIIIIAGGIKWMTAGGNEGNIDQAKKILTAGVVGMIIVFLAYGITAFIFNVVLSNPWGW
jgi:cbb3-type cytochrome oxidase subunit 3